MSSGSNLAYGIMCSGTRFPLWQAEVIRQLGRVGAHPQLLLLDGRVEDKRLDWFRRIRSASSHQLFFRTYRKLFVHPRSHRTVDLSQALRDVEHLRCTPVRKGKYSEYFRDEDLEKIRAFRLDFLLRFAFGIIRGGILEAAQHGVWSFHHDDETKYRGSPPCFWEIYSRDPVSGVLFQRLTERLDGGVVLRRGHFQTESSYEKNIDRVYLPATVFPAQVCKDLLNGKLDRLTQEPSKTEAKSYRVPSQRQMVTFLGRSLAARLKSRLDWARSQEHWAVGVVPSPINQLKTGMADVQWLQFPLEGNLADPFGVNIDGRLHVLCEYMPPASRVGTIAWLVLEADRIVEWGLDVLGESAHASYPYLFRADGEYWCVPETKQLRQVTLYRAIDITQGRWEREAVILKDYAGGDPTLRFHEGRWWMWSQNGEEADGRANVYLHYAKSLTGPWHPHALNPVKLDVRSARPGGSPFMVGNSLFRPAQDCSRAYGSRISLQHVIRMNPQEYEELEVDSVEPASTWPFRAGLHTISAVGDRTLVDAKTIRPASLATWQRRLSKLTGWVPSEAQARGKQCSTTSGT